MHRPTLSHLVRAGLYTAAADGLFSSVLSVAFYHSTVARLFQGVASTLLGPPALTGGTKTALIGLAMHVGVAFGWSAVFLFLVMRVPFVRDVLSSPWGTAKVAVIYGPIVWMAMSLLIIPFLLHRPPGINNRWWVQFFGQMPFAAGPIVAVGRRSLGGRRESTHANTAGT
jgi:hypothetical protein